ncbi:MAG: hypothetical protein ICV87_05685, partial [Gemmatimonadetes bacterium]|nr:hypothetical protein [Gemmatimonadota bacterium]
MAAVVLAFALLVAVANTALFYGLTYGDAAIHFVYAKNFREYGFFHYNTLGPSSGSSSPLWTILLGLPFLLPDPEPAVRGFSILVFFAGAPLAYYAARSRTGSVRSGLWGASIWLILFPAHELTAVSFETVFAAALVLAGAAIALAQSERDASNTEVLALGLLVGLLPVTRVELALVAGAIFSGTAARHPRRAAPMLLGALATGMPYFVWSLLATGSAIPQSASGRLVGDRHLAANATALAQGLLYLAAPVGVILLAGSAVWFIPRAGRMRVVWLVTAAYLLTLVLTGPIPFYLLRYALPVAIPAAVLLSADVLERGRSARNRRVRNATAWLFPLFMAAYGAGTVKLAYGFHRVLVPSLTWNELFEKSLVTRLNRIAGPDERVLVYEIQTQYHLRAVALSLDGIVGGQVLPYLRAGSDLSDFLWEYRPALWVANDAIHTRREFEHSILRKVHSAKLRVGESTSGRGMTFTKLLERRGEPPPSVAGWRAVYRIDYGAVSPHRGRPESQHAAATHSTSPAR